MTRVKITRVIAPAGFNILDRWVEEHGGTRSDYQSATALEPIEGKMGLLHIRFDNGVETCLNRMFIEEIKEK